MAPPSTTSVGLGQILVLEDKGCVRCNEIGSTVALVAYIPEDKIGGVAHIVLPEGTDSGHAARYANRAPQALVEALCGKQGNKQILFAYVGGSQVLHGQGSESWSDLGARNVLAIEQQLQSMDATVVATDTGGAYGRSLTLDVSTGALTISSFTRGSQVLCNFIQKLEAA